MPGLRSIAPSPGVVSGRLSAPDSHARSARAALSVASSGPRARSRAARALVDVAMRDGDVEIVLVAVALGEVLGDRDRAVPPAGAADRDDEMRLALGDVLRQQEVEQRVQAHVEVVEPAVARDELDDRLVEPG